jgi:hypothetical protein
VAFATGAAVGAAVGAAAGAAATGAGGVVVMLAARTAAGGGGGGHTTHGVGGHSRQSSGAVKTRGVHAVTTLHGHPSVPGVHATPSDVKHAGVAQLLFTVATQKDRPC